MKPSPPSPPPLTVICFGNETHKLVLPWLERAYFGVCENRPDHHHYLIPVDLMASLLSSFNILGKPEQTLEQFVAEGVREYIQTKADTN